MSQTGDNIVEVKPAANIYTVLLVVAALALLLSMGLAGHRVMAETPKDVGTGGGYGMTFGDVLSPKDTPSR